MFNKRLMKQIKKLAQYKKIPPLPLSLQVLQLNCSVESLYLATEIFTIKFSNLGCLELSQQMS